MPREPHLKLVAQPVDDGIAGWLTELAAEYPGPDAELLWT